MTTFKILKYIPLKVICIRLIKKILAPIVNKKPKYKPLTIENNSEFNPILYSNQTHFSLFDIQESIINHYTKNKFKIFSENFVEYSLNKKFTNKFVDENYISINWQLDYQSNFIFDKNKPSKNIKIPKGVDVKVPWELGRLQHLPQMCIYGLLNDNKTYLQLAKNQFFDFVFNNPSGFGVNWMNAMEASIRLCNVLITFDLLFNILNDIEKNIFKNSIENHVIFINSHLEKKEGLSGNHYLFNLIGLLFYGTYFNSSNSNKIFEFAFTEIQKEIDKQFFNDGGNFEGSTAYHCHVMEVLLVAYALIQRKKLYFKPSIHRKMVNAISLFKAMLKPDNTIPVFGDYDGGRLFKLSASAMELNKYRDYTFLLNYINAFTNENEKDTFENIFLKSYAQGNLAYDFKEFNKHINHPINYKRFEFNKTTEISFENIDIQKLKKYYFKEFGLVIIKSNEFYLALSLIANKKMHHSWGHVHNDKLSFELQVHQNDIVTDPGTLCYTSNLSLRERFRSTQAHHTILVKNKEQNNSLSASNPFYLDHESTCALHELTNQSIAASVKYYGVAHYRVFEITENKLIINDFCNQPFEVNINKFKLFAPSYGILIEK